MKINSKQFFYIMIAFTVLSFGGIVGAFYWGENMLISKSKTLTELQTTSDIAQEKILKLSQAEQSKELSDEAVALLATLLPAQKEQEKLIADVIYTASTETSIPLANISSLTFASSSEPSDLSGTEESKDVAGVYTYPFSLSIIDISYDTLLRLLSQIENNSRLIQVENIQISPDKTVPGQISNVSLALKAFLQP